MLKQHLVVIVLVPHSVNHANLEQSSTPLVPRTFAHLDAWIFILLIIDSLIDLFYGRVNPASHLICQTTRLHLSSLGCFVFMGLAV